MEPESTVRHFTVESGGDRIDRFLATRLSDLSRTAVQRLIDGGQITVNGLSSTASARVRAGDEIVVRIPPPAPVALQPESIPLDIVYEDVDILVINKPPGMVVHPGAGHSSGTLVNAVLAHCPDLPGIGGEVRPGVVHRLDKDTSGLIVMAKHDRALLGLQRQFRRRTVQKVYTALVLGRISQEEGLIEAPIARDRHHRRRMAVRGDGKLARTRWRVTGAYRDRWGQVYTLLDVRLLTGRTHQIRVHFSWMGYPLAGDTVYGRATASEAFPRQFLHARELAFDHPTTGEHMNFEASLPADLQTVLDALERVDV